MASLKFQPFIKWAGGKRSLLPELLSRVPENFNNYFEPFVGGGALFFELKRLGLLDNKKVYLFDKNKELINTYKVVQNHHNKLLKLLKVYQEKHSHDFYYETRAMDRDANFADLDPVERAARFIYLNKTCFNGLYRVNSKGYHNVPLGSYKNPNIYDENVINLSSIALQGATIEAADFSKTLEYANANDFVYFDPPYYPLNPTSSFTAYHEDVFLDDEQKRLFEVFKELVKKGVYAMHSNSDTDFIKELYKEYKIDFVDCARFINSKSCGRGKIKEVLVRNIR
jgi:DNA adenine methylase